MGEKELVMYGRTFACWDQTRAMSFLEKQRVSYRFVDIGRDAEAARRLQGWVGHLSVPTLVVAAPGTDMPLAEPTPLRRGGRARGLDRGTLITEPNDQQLADFLRHHGLL